jgi:hypothetical protein
LFFHILGIIVASHQKIGKDFFLVGDFAWIRDLKDANLTFGAMNAIKKQSKKNFKENKINEDDIDYFITMGDNLYPEN